MKEPSLRPQASRKGAAAGEADLKDDFWDAKREARPNEKEKDFTKQIQKD